MVNTHAQVLTTVAGGTVVDGAQATATPLSVPKSVIVLPSGEFILAETAGNLIRQVDASGVMRILAGGGALLDDRNGVPARSAQFNEPVFLVRDAAGNIYFSDSDNHRVRKLTPSGLVTTVAGDGVAGFFGDGGPASAARLQKPRGLALDTAGNLYIADSQNYVIRKVDTAGNITTVAGQQGRSCPGDLSPPSSCGDGGPALGALFNEVFDLAFDRSGRLLVADYFSRRVRRIDLNTGIVQAFAGSGVFGFTGDGGSALQARFATPGYLAVDSAGNVYISDEFNHRVRMVRASNNVIITVAGGGSNLGSGFAALATALNFPTGLFLDGANNLWVMDAGNALVRRMNLSTGIMTTVAGTLDVADNGPALRGVLSLPRHIRLDSAGNLYIADESHHRIRKVSVSTGVITTVAGNGLGRYAGDSGPATSASLYHPFSVAVDDAGNLYIADTDNHRVRKVAAGTGIITTIAGTGVAGFAGDGGQGTAAQLNRPLGVALDRAGNLYICDADSRVRRLNLNTGIISTFAGRTQQGFAGDGGPASLALMFQPTDVAFTSQGDAIIADTRNQVVRRVDARTGVISTIAGTPNVSGYTGDGGPARFARLSQPVALAVDRSDNIYVADFNDTVRKIAPDGTITTVAGSGLGGFSPDGTPARLARFSLPFGLALDGAGNLLMGELANRIRAIRFDLKLETPRLKVSPASLDFQVEETAALPAARSLQVANVNFGAMNWTATVATSSGDWLNVTPASGSAPSSADVIINPVGLAPGTYSGSVSVGAPGATDSPQSISVQLTVTRSGPRLAVSSTFLTFQTAEGTDPAPQAVSIQNAGGGGAFSWTAAGGTRNGGSWLALSDTSGSTPQSLNIAPRVSTLKAGSYQGQVVVVRAGSSEQVTIEVVLLVTASQQPVLQVSQPSFTFYGTEGALRIPARTLSLVNAGGGTLRWSVEVSSGLGGEWLRANVLQGGAGLSAGQLGKIELRPRPGNLKAGVYSALVVLKAPGAKNAPQSISVRLRVQTSGEAPRALLDPGGLIFQAAQGSASPALDTVQVNTTGGETALSFLAQPTTESGGAWLSVTPQASALFGSSETVTLSVQANPQGLAAGAYRGKIAVSFSNGVLETIPVLLVVTPVGAAQGPAPSRWEAAACAPGRTFLAVRQVAHTFKQSVGWPSQLTVEVRDNCGNPTTDGVVVASFSSGDPPLTLTHRGGGEYSAPWVPKQGVAQVDITFVADHRTLGRTTARYTASVASAAVPSIGDGAIVHAASYTRHLAPGSLISLFGTNLATQVAGASSLPLPTQLASTSVRIGDRDAPLLYVGPGQINLQIPWEAGESTISTVVVTSAGVASAGEFLTIQTAQPGIFALSGDGRGQGAILSAQYRVVDAANPAAAGDVLQIFAAGLGAASPPAKTGEPAPSSPLSLVTNSVRCTVGGLEAPVEFQGLSPGFVGLYQVNVRVPAGVTPGPSVPVVLIQNGISSNRVSIAVK